MSKDYDIIVTGAGIVGLATAYNLQKKYPNARLCILEKESKVAAHQTGHNSGVIHSGIYYKPGSLKAQNCIRGYKYLLEFCNNEGITYDLCGKVIVATNESELPQLENIYKRGIENGLTEISKISKEELKEIEPHARGVAAIKVPYTGIIDYKEVSRKLAEILQKNGAEIKFSEGVNNIKSLNGSGAEVITPKSTYKTKVLVNCTGLHSDKLASMTESKVDFRIVPFRGEYYKIRPEREYLVKTLIYPVPDPNFPFLGVHFTRMIEGGVEAGPNAVLAFKREGYKKTDFNIKDTLETASWKGFRQIAGKYWKTGMGEFHRSFSKKAFVKALQNLLPEIQEDDLIPGGAGVRAQACSKDGGLIDDFLILNSGNIINVCNAPSPAATSSLSIGETISSMVKLN